VYRDSEMYVHGYVCSCMFMDMYVHVCSWICKFMYVHGYVCSCMFIDMYVHVCSWICMFMDMYVHVCSWICMFMYGHGYMNHVRIILKKVKLSNCIGLV